MVRDSKKAQVTYKRKRDEKGDKKVSVWFTPGTTAQIKKIQAKTKWSVEIVVSCAVELLHYVLILRNAKWSDVIKTIKKHQSRLKREKEKLLNK